MKYRFRLDTSSKKNKKMTAKLFGGFDKFTQYWFRILEYGAIVSLLAFVSAVVKTPLYKILFVFSVFLLIATIQLSIASLLNKIIIPSKKLWVQIMFFVIDIILIMSSSLFVGKIVFLGVMGFVEQWLWL